MVKKLQALRAKKGFTLVELIVVIAIIGVLAAILVPVMMGQVTKAKINSLDSTAKTVVTTVNTWIADRYSNGKSGNIDGVWSCSQSGGTVTVTGTATVATGQTATTTGAWGITEAQTTKTSLAAALKEAYNFAADDNVKFWIQDGKCVAAVYKQGGAVDTNVSYSTSSGWTSLAISNEKDGIVNEGSTSGSMVGTYPKYKAAASNNNQQQQQGGEN